MSQQVVLSWSGGKDSALALDVLLRDPKWEVVSLLTTLTHGHERVSMHGVHRELVLQQAESLQIPLAESWIERGTDNVGYEAAMSESLLEFKRQGVDIVAFGDLFLEEIRAYRDCLVDRIGMQSEYPIWGEETSQLARQFVDRGFRAMTCCVDTAQIPESFCGREIDHAFLDQLPSSADSCGENGEFHTFVFDSPMMSFPIKLELGTLHQDGQFLFQDLTLPNPVQSTESGATI